MLSSSSPPSQHGWGKSSPGAIFSTDVGGTTEASRWNRHYVPIPTPRNSDVGWKRPFETIETVHVSQLGMEVKGVRLFLGTSVKVPQDLEATVSIYVPVHVKGHGYNSFGPVRRQLTSPHTPQQQQLPTVTGTMHARSHLPVSSLCPLGASSLLLVCRPS